MTVANYCDAKIPNTTGDDREAAILNSVEKWIGSNTFEVSLEKVHSADQGSRKGQKRLVAKYRSKRSRFDRGPPPSLHYVVATTCPRSVKLIRSRADKFNWIGVCFLEDLIVSELIPARLKDSILSAQTKCAGRSSAP